jgi:hypothetical protein
VCSLKMPAAIIIFLMFFILPSLFCLLYCILNCISICMLNCIPSSIDIGPYFIVSISLTNSLFSQETVKYSNIIAWKKVFLNKRCLEPTTADINYIAKAPRFSHHDCGVIEQKSCGSKVPYKDSIALHCQLLNLFK